MEKVILLLIFIPVVFSGMFLLSSKQAYYKVISALLCLIGTLLAVLLVISGPQKIPIDNGIFKIIQGVILIGEIFIIFYLYYVSIKSRKWSVLAFTIIQTLLSIYTVMFLERGELFSSERLFNVDKLSLAMALIVNVIGTLILVFSNGYITQYEQHRKMKSRQKLFYSTICIFLSAMNGIIFSDSLSWIYFFWEITTLTSFILISYNGDSEAADSGFRALFFNMIGGIAFSLGIILFKVLMNIGSLSEIELSGKLTSYYIIPIFLLCIAGFAKSAQMPFQSWLLGAMVAPTPISALLHSSTMVKAGVFLIIKLSPAYAGTNLGNAIAVYGGITFLICSAIAVSQRNAKRVLAYSTIANLGLIISSAGLGTSIAISAAIMLIIFHAISKALLFLCTGQIEHTIGSRDIEDMTGLIKKAPLLTTLTALGMVSMLLPPFGVLITKWLSIEAAAQNPIVAVLIILGSAFTTVFWIKWLGTVLSYPDRASRFKAKINILTYVPLAALGTMVLLTSVFISPMYNYFVSPEIKELLNVNSQITAINGNVYSPMGAFDDTVIFLILICTIIIYGFIKKLIVPVKIKKVYLCGENSPSSSDNTSFREGANETETAVVSNLYFNGVLNEKRFTEIGYALSTAMIAAVFIGGLLL